VLCKGQIIIFFEKEENLIVFRQHLFEVRSFYSTFQGSFDPSFESAVGNVTKDMYSNIF